MSDTGKDDPIKTDGTNLEDDHEASLDDKTKKVGMKRQIDETLLNEEGMKLET
jgi:hypothetical protein